ncbi:MAG: AAA family ATPase, partial [Clostridia bacterium]
MLLELSIHHIALIDALTIDFQKGFNVLTGETGAGKSIVVGAVSLMLGERADRDLLQTGAKRGSVEALFAIADHREVQAFLRELELETDGDSRSIAREITDTGRTVCRIAGVSVPLATLRRVT